MFSADKVLKALAGGDLLWGDVYTEEKTYTHIHMESGRIEKVERGLDRGVGLRVVSPWRTFYGSTTSFDEKELVSLARELAGLSGKARKKAVKMERPVTAAYPFAVEVSPGGVEMFRKIDLVRKVEAMARSMENRITQVRVIFRDSRQAVTIHTTEGRSVEDDRTQVVLNLLVVGEEGGNMQTAYEAIGGFRGFEFFDDGTVETFVEKTVKRLTGLLGAVEAPMGTRTVVLSSEAGGTMIHEAIGHGLEADLAMEGLSCYKGKVGEAIASPLISVVDDATVPFLRGTYAFDDEGVASRRTLLVDKGVLKNYLYDRFHAAKYGREATGNGRRESFRYKPIPRMSNTMILPGKDDPAAILASVDDGILVVKMGGGQVDTVRGDFVFEISEGYRIRKGKAGEMIRNATLMGNGPKVLEEIDMVGSDLGFGIGTCGKDGQGAPVSDAQPTLRIPQIVVGGRETG